PSAPPGPRAAGAGRPALGGVRQGRGAPVPGEAPAPPEAIDRPAPAPDRPLPTREELTLAWADSVLGALRPIAKGLFSAGRFAAVDDRVVTFAVPTDAMRVKCEARRGDVEAALAAFYGRPVPLRVIVDPSTTVQVADGGAPAALPSEHVDLDELEDAPPEHRSGFDRLTEAFPGSEVVDGGGA
ncbi:MAG TPA: hypothetical protein VGR26_10915, partial [Acidimicrobiales bacterium]|nr:hypothetical protein [Acidimicrobiales bacterium]